jgi:hypothetical protein
MKVMKVKVNHELFNALRHFEVIQGVSGLASIVQNDMDIPTSQIAEFLTRCKEIVARKKEEVDVLARELNELSGKVMLHIVECNNEVEE